MVDLVDLYEPVLDRPDYRGLIPVEPDEEPGAIGSFAREFGRMVGPTAGGVAAFPAGAAVGGALAAPIAPFFGPGAPLVEGAGVIGGGLAASFGAGFAIERAQGELPDNVKRMLGWDDATRAADAEANPYATFAGQLAPQLLFMRPGFMGVKPALAGAAIGGGVEAGVEVAAGEDIDPFKVGAQALFGGTLGANTRFGDMVQIPAHAVVSIPYGAGATAAMQGARDTLRAGIDAVATAQENSLARLYPKLPESVQARWRAAGTADDWALIAAAEQDLGPRMTPAERKAITVIEQEVHARESSPFLPGAAADAAAGARLGVATSALLAGERVPGMPWEAAPRVGTRPEYHAAIEAIESGGRQIDDDGLPLTSSAGAIGVMQVMPGTAPYAAKLAGVEFDPLRYRRDPAYNRMLGKAYFDEMLRQFGGDPLKAAAAYNAGPGSAKSGRGVRGAMARAAREGGSWIDHLPAETRDYVAKFVKRTGAETRAGSSGPVLNPAHFPDEASWALAQDAMDAEIVGGEAWAAVRPAEDAAAIGEAGATARAAEFDALARFDDLSAFVSARQRPITPADVADALGIPTDHAARLISRAAREDNAGFRIVNGRAIRNPRSDGPEDVLSFVGRAGGVVPNDRHSLGAGGRDWNKVMLPGMGPLARRGGKSVDELGELLWDAGFFGAGADRPDESAVMELIERAVAARGERRKIFRPEDQADADAVEAEARGASQLEGLRQRYEDAMEEAGVPASLTDDDVAGIQRMAEEIGAADDIDAIDAWLSRPVEDGEFVPSRFEDEGDIDPFDVPFDTDTLARFDEIDGEGAAMQAASIEHDLRMAIEADPELSVRLGEGENDMRVGELLDALDADDAAIGRLRMCAAPRAPSPVAMGSAA